MQVIAGMIGFLGLLGLCVSVLYVLWALLNVVRRKGKAEVIRRLKHAGYIFLASFIGLVIMLIMADPNSKTDINDQKQQAASKPEPKDPVKVGEEKTTASPDIKIDLNEQKPQVAQAPAPQKAAEKTPKKSNASSDIKIDLDGQAPQPVSDVDTKAPVKKVAGKKPDPTNTAPSASGLGMSAQKFKSEYNKIIGQINGQYKIGKLKIDRGEVADAFSYDFAKNVALVGTINKDSSLNEILIIMTGSESYANNMMAVAVILSSCQAVNGQIATGEHSTIVSDMIKKAADKIDTGESVERYVGDLKYSTRASSVMGFMFSISKT